jgi:outer membrane protein assembly factor BamB
VIPRAAGPVSVLLLLALGPGCGGSSSSSSPSPSPSSPSGAAASVVQHHNSARRDGVYVQSGLTKARAATMQLDASFNGSVQGDVYAQPLYVANGPGGLGTFYVVTESNNVYALDEQTGTPRWSQTLGAPAGETGAGCGNISPLGITGTPYIDLSTRTLYLDAVMGNATSIGKHLIHALSIDDGSERSGWPLDTAIVQFGGLGFNPVVQNQRGALLVVGDTLYVPYGGHAGDCSDYRGWVIGVPLANPTGAKAWATGVRGGGIWAPGGLASDGSGIFAATGNTFGARTWEGGEAILRFQPGPVFSAQPVDFFAPSNWKMLDTTDLDLGGSGPLLVDLPGATPSGLVVALSKAGVAHLLDRSNLGGVGTGNGRVGEGVFSAQVADGEIINAAAAYSTANGTFVAFHAHGGAQGRSCPAGQGGNLVALKLIPGAPPALTTAWCADSGGEGSPIVTTTDGISEMIIWAAGAEGTERLRAWDAETGQLLYGGGGAGDVMNRVRRFTTPIAVRGRILVGADNRLFAFRAQ